MKKKLYKRILSRVLLEIAKIIIPIIDYFIPKDKKIVVFSQPNNLFSDNIKALYLYMLDINNTFNIFWLANSKEMVDSIITNYPQAKICKKYSLDGFYIFLRAKYVILSHGKGDYGFYQSYSNKKITIMLWHAISLKKYGDLDLSRKIKNEKLESYSYSIASSFIDAFTVSLCQKVHIDKILTVGLPRNDNLLLTQHKQPAVLKRIEKYRIILYAPTFRDFGETLFFPFIDFELNALASSLEKNNAKLLVRPHKNDLKSIDKIKSIASIENNIIYTGSSVLSDVNELLPFVDCIVTDYSSIYIDLLLKDVPPIFIPYDLEEYDRVRGLAYDYELVTPGPKVLTQKEFINAIEDALNGAPKYKEKRHFVKKMFHKYEDGQACKRIVEAMEKLV